MSNLLANDISAFTARHNRSPGVMELLGRVAGKIKQAQLFHFDDNVRLAIGNLLEQRPSSLLDAASFAKPPFNICWFEWSPNPSGIGVRDGQVKVARIGALIETVDDGGAFKFFTAWRYSDTKLGFGVSALQAGVDYVSCGAFNGPSWARRPSDLTEMDVIREVAPGSRGMRFAVGDKYELDSLNKLDRAISLSFNAQTSAEYVRHALKENAVAATYDVLDEIPVVFSLMVLLNAKNCVEVERVSPPDRLNRARRRRGHPEIIGYSKVSIVLGRADARAAHDESVTHADIRRHIVRGHFKVKKNGVYWWRPFLRGSLDAGLLGRKAYEVRT